MAFSSHLDCLTSIILVTLFAHCAFSAYTLDFASGRRWYFAGSFDSFYSQYTPFTATSVSNVVFLDSSGNNGELQHLGGENGGVDGPVNALHVDLCWNLYVGGSFAHALDELQQVDTGPLARFSFSGRKWERVLPEGIVFQGTELGANSTFTGGTVNSIVSDCVHFAFCSCDIYFGGNFTLTDSNGKTAISLAKYEASSGKVLALNPDSWEPWQAVVTALYKKTLGVTVATTYLWVGGENLGTGVHFGRVSLGDSAWKSFPEVNGRVRSFEYISATIGLTDKLFVGGDFDFEESDGAKCKYICQFSHDSLKWTEVTDKLTGPVYSLQRNEKTLYAAGNFSHAVLIVSGNDVEYIDTNQQDKISYTQDVHSMTVCARLDLACKGGTVLMAGSDGFLNIYNTKKLSFENFGQRINGDVHVVASAFHFRSDATRAAQRGW
eukprot:CAMPEP_0117447302 /NCGR_PEP_ID=MMETSP0759-20121206/6801_1 /TAXON_ID=63605 /ORGANISM="Percolomonas cosmopolitus, Strain WS" /LENGTH=436 /DNA_ID=CAMNT_0005239625 /DNA_START=170 /DNA_END=1477 /DNA_ORIENTATION=-